MLTSLRSVLNEVEVPTETAVEISAIDSANPPSNKQILDAARAAYSEYQKAVDATTQALINTIKDSDMTDALEKLDGTNWSSSGVSSDIVEPFFSSLEVQTALGVVRKTSTNLKTFSIGVFAKSLPIGQQPGMISFARSIVGAAQPKLTLQLDIFQSIVSVDKTRNLQYGVWLPRPTALHDCVLGFYINTNVQEISLNMKILLTQSLKPYGFVVSSGASLPVNQGVFSGKTSLL
jgi:hypothetical protein